MVDLDVPSLIGGRYRGVRLIGSGGMGAVYEVEHLHTGQRLALKVLTLRPGSSVERFKREARAAALIPSDHVVRVTDADVAPELGGAPYLVMELLEGADLGRVTADRPAAPADVVEWLRQVARALVKAHERGIVHRDLKPENLFLTHRDDGSPLVKVLDFGIAKIAADPVGLTQSDQFLGTPLYMAPEQADGRGLSVTSRADLYALGLTAFRLLIGHSYWSNGSMAQLLAQILASPMAPPSARGSALGPAFDAWFLRACDRDPSKRFASADEQIERLAEAIGLPRKPRISDPVPKRLSDRTLPSGLAPTPTGSATDVPMSKGRVGWKGWTAAGIAGGVAVLVAFAAASRTIAVPRNATADASRSWGESEASPPLEAERSAVSPPKPPPLADAEPPVAASAQMMPSASATTRPPAASNTLIMPRLAPRVRIVDASRLPDPLEGQQ